MASTQSARSLTELHDRWAGPLHAFARRRLGDRESAEEVVQDTLLRAWRHADRFDPQRGTEGAWLFAMARNLVIDRQRRRRVRPLRADSVAGDAIERHPAADDSSLDGLEVERMLETWQLADAMARLSAEHREAIVLCHYRGHSVAEASRLLDVPPGTIKSRVYYGLRALRLHLQEQGVMP